MKTHRWNDGRWQRLAEAAEVIRAESFRGASDAVAASLDKRLGFLADLSRNVDRGGSEVNDMLRDNVHRELTEYLRVQRAAFGAVLLVRWPLSLPARLRLAAGLSEVEWIQLEVQAPRRFTAIKRDLFLYELLVGPSVASLLVAGHLKGGDRRESSPTGGKVLPEL